MDKEISKTFAIVITIIALGVVIAIGFSSLKFGKKLDNEATDKVITEIDTMHNVILEEESSEEANEQ